MQPFGAHLRVFSLENRCMYLVGFARTRATRNLCQTTMVYFIEQVEYLFYEDRLYAVDSKGNWHRICFHDSI